MKKNKLAIACTHPIQYYAPLFKVLADKIGLKVFFTGLAYAKQGGQITYDEGFGRRIQWDVPLLEGYDFVFSGRNTINEIEDYNPDSVLVYGWPFKGHLKIMRHFKGKVWFRGDSIRMTDEWWGKSVAKWFSLRWVYSHIEKAFYVGTLNKIYFKQYGLQPAQLIFAPHAVDNARFSAAGDSVWRTRLLIPETDVVILFAGKFNRNKNPLLLLEAFARLGVPGIHLIFAGDGPLKGELTAAVRKTHGTYLLSFQNQQAMPALYRSCDLFCMPSENETWGLSVNEAMAAGKAILISDGTGASADLVADQNGRIFKKNDLNDLRDKILDLISDKERLADYGRQSAALIQNWTMEKQAQAILSAFNPSSQLQEMTSGQLYSAKHNGPCREEN